MWLKANHTRRSDLPRGEVVMGGGPIGSPSRSGYALRLGARIRPTALRSSLPKSEDETSLPVDIDPASCEGLPLSKSIISAGGDTKDPYHAYTTSSMTSAGGQTNHSPQSEGVARTTGGYKTSPVDRPLVGRTREPTYRVRPTRGGSHTGHIPLASVDHLLGNRVGRETKVF